MKVLLDANVVVAAFAARGLCHAVYELCLSRHRILLSDPLIKEIQKSLRDRIKVPAPTVHEIASFLRREALMEILAPLTPGECRDPDDLHGLGLAAAGKPDIIVSGDKDLLVLKHSREIPIVSPRAFWDIAKAE